MIIIIELKCYFLVELLALDELQFHPGKQIHIKVLLLKSFESNISVYS